MSRFPLMCDVQQHFDTTSVSDVAAEVHTQLNTLALPSLVQPGQSVAITAGSRGIANIDTILRECVRHLKSLGAEPFIVPAMGSHGGGNVAGQLEVLRGFGITEDAMEAPIRATMETVVVAETSFGIPVHFDRFAHEADHVLVVGRVKPHTRFVGPIESGLHKMLLIGLGKRAGAEVYHQGIMSHSFTEMIDSVAERVLQTCGVIGGLAILENAMDETALLEAVPPEQFAVREPELLKLANQWLPTLPVNDVDLLIVDRIGKNISGVGMDANVIGRKFNDHAATDQDLARCVRIFVRALTEETRGNACGIGVAEFTTQRCVDQIDHEKTRINCITSNHPEVAMIPITYPTDARAVENALKTVGRVAPENARVVQIADTLHLARTRVSEALFPLIERADAMELVGTPYPFPIDEHGRLSDVPTG